MAVVGATAVVSQLIGAPFSWAPVAGSTALAAGLCIALRRFNVFGVGGNATLGAQGWLLVATSTLVGGSAIAVQAFARLPTADRVSQTYDGVFHLNAVSYILDTGDGSSLDLYRMTHPGDGFEFYPAAWHDIVALLAQLTGVGVPAAANAAWIAIAAAVWVPGCVLLTVTLLPKKFESLRLVAASIAAVLASCFAAYPALLLEWGTLYPTGLAYALLPSGLAIGIALLAPNEDESRPRRLLPRVLLASVWLVAAANAHPRSLASVAVLIAPLVIVRLLGAGVQMLRGPQARRFVVISAAAVLALAAAAVVGWLFVYRTYHLAERPISDHLNGGPAVATQSFGAALMQVLMQAPVSNVAPGGLPWAVVPALLVVVGLAIATRQPALRWMVFAYCLVALLYCLAAGSNSDAAKLLTGIWYKDKYRVIAIIPTLAVPLATGALVWLASEFARLVPAARRGTSLGNLATLPLTLAVLGTTWFGATSAGSADSIAEAFALPAGAKGGYLMNADEEALLRRLPELVPAGSVIVGNPWDGSTLAWAIGDRQPLFPHFTGAWTADQLLVASSLDQIGSNPKICAALGRLDAQYLLASDGLMWNGDPQAQLYSGIDRAVAAGVGHEVAVQGDSRLYRLDDCA